VRFNRGLVRVWTWRHGSSLRRQEFVFPTNSGPGHVAATNALDDPHDEARLSTVRYIVGNIEGCQGGDHIARWTAAGLLEAEKEIRRVRGYSIPPLTSWGKGWI